MEPYIKNHQFSNASQIEGCGKSVYGSKRFMFAILQLLLFTVQWVFQHDGVCTCIMLLDFSGSRKRDQLVCLNHFGNVHKYSLMQKTSTAARGVCWIPTPFCSSLISGLPRIWLPNVDDILLRRLHQNTQHKWRTQKKC